MQPQLFDFSITIQRGSLYSFLWGDLYLGATCIQGGQAVFLLLQRLGHIERLSSFFFCLVKVCVGESRVCVWGWGKGVLGAREALALALAFLGEVNSVATGLLFVTLMFSYATVLCNRGV